MLPPVEPPPELPELPVLEELALLEAVLEEPAVSLPEDDAAVDVEELPELEVPAVAELLEPRVPPLELADSVLLDVDSLVPLLLVPADAFVLESPVSEVGVTPEEDEVDPAPGPPVLASPEEEPPVLARLAELPEPDPADAVASVESETASPVVVPPGTPVPLELAAFCRGALKHPARRAAHEIAPRTLRIARW